MPQLPVYNAQRNVDANIHEPLRDEVTQKFSDQQKVIGAVTQITQKWSDAHDVMQYTQARASYEKIAADVHARAAQDPDMNNAKKYVAELDDAKNLSLSKISNKQVAGNLANELDLANIVTGEQIDNLFKKKQLEYNKVFFQASLESLEQKKLAAATPALRAQHEHDISELIQKNVSSGVLSYEEAIKVQKDAQETGVKYEIYSDMSTKEEDSSLLKKLKDPSGEYSYLDPKTRLQMIEESQRRIFQNNQTFKRDVEVSKNERFNNIFTKANEGTLTLSDLDAEMKVSEEQGGIPKQQLLSIRNSIQSRVKNDLETIVNNNAKAEEYLKFVDGFISDETDRQKGREAIVNAFKDNILSPQEAAFLNKLKRETEEIKWDREVKPNNLIPFKNAITAVGAWFRGKQNSAEKEAAMAIKKLLSGAAAGEDVEKMVPLIINEDRVKSLPDIKSFPETGVLMHDPVSNVDAMVFPDGHIEAVK